MWDYLGMLLLHNPLSADFADSSDVADIYLSKNNYDLFILRPPSRSGGNPFLSEPALAQRGKSAYGNFKAGQAERAKCQAVSDAAVAASSLRKTATTSFKVAS
jgi:hypothetical protein